MEAIPIIESVFEKVSKMTWIIEDKADSAFIVDESLEMNVVLELSAAFSLLPRPHNITSGEGVAKFMEELGNESDTRSLTHTTLRYVLETLLSCAKSNNWHITIIFPSPICGIKRMDFNFDLFEDGIASMIIATERGINGIKKGKSLRVVRSTDRHIRIVYDYV